MFDFAQLYQKVRWILRAVLGSNVPHHWGPFPHRIELACTIPRLSKLPVSLRTSLCGPYGIVLGHDCRSWQFGATWNWGFSFSASSWIHFTSTIIRSLERNPNNAFRFSRLSVSPSAALASLYGSGISIDSIKSIIS